MGTMLQTGVLSPGDIPELLNITDKHSLIDIHKAYIDSGANLIYANTFGANRFKLENTPYSVEQIIKSGIENAKEAACNSDCLIALDIGPLGKLFEPSGDLTVELAYECYSEIVTAGTAAGADVIVLETMTDLLETKTALLAAKENSSLPVLVSMTFEENGRTFTGVNIPSMALTLEGLGADAIGLNCSLGPAQLEKLVLELTKYTSLPLLLKPNAGMPNPDTNCYDVTPEDFSILMAELAEKTDGRIKYFGGCCGTTPEYIKILSDKLANFSSKKAESRLFSAICSGSHTVEIDSPKIIGERINPTGKKLFKEALKNDDMDYILNQALSQIEAGADILDVNVGLPEINEKEMMVKVIKALQEITVVPLQIDSTIPEVIEAALRVYNGKPIVNSVNGEESSLNEILPLVKKYGASVVCLTLDENGIPKTSEKRIEIAQKIIDRALSLDIPAQDIYIDCLTLTASAEQDAVKETLKAVSIIKKQLGFKTILGVSNISFGLPNRELVNQAFLTMALENGLDLPIINPNVASMTGAVRAYRLLSGADRDSKDFISFYGSNTNTAPSQSSAVRPISLGEQLLASIQKGLGKECTEITEELLKNNDSMYIVDNFLIPALDETGTKFESGKIFLPQLINSANAAQACFGVIKKHMTENNTLSVSKGKILLATVKGDIHDIGKNIVKILLENYGYEIIDLGRDVAPEHILNTVIEQDIKLVGLSALMTTTLSSMEFTISLLRDKGIKCKIMVGGAVLTKEYAEKINADFYAKDAKEAVDIAKTFFKS